MSPLRLILQRTCPQGITVGRACNRMPDFLIFVPFKSPFLKNSLMLPAKCLFYSVGLWHLLWAVQNRLEFWILLPVGIIIAHLPIISNLFKHILLIATFYPALDHSLHPANPDNCLHHDKPHARQISH